jgi:drug/metabolite transporter (DMT)-like permease
MALFGAVIGPVALAWGLQRTSGAGASLMLTLEAVFTAVLARLWYHETLDRRVAVAMTLLTLGGMALVLDRADSSSLGRGQHPLACRGRRDPGQVVMFKGALGATATTALAWVFGEPLPSLWQAAALLMVGATGYGLSLRFYLLAQRAFGAARTGSVFAFAPFVGTALAFMLGDRTNTIKGGSDTGYLAWHLSRGCQRRITFPHLSPEQVPASFRDPVTTCRSIGAAGRRRATSRREHCSANRNASSPGSISSQPGGIAAAASAALRRPMMTLP